MKREVQLYNFKSFGSAIKEARNEHKMSRKDVSDRLDISLFMSTKKCSKYKRKSVALRPVESVDLIVHLLSVLSRGW
jgi:transcriptional regulator with XRE-family HTH domain